MPDKYEEQNDKDVNEQLYDLYDNATKDEREEIDRGFSTYND